MNIGRIAYSSIPAPANTSSLKYARGYTADIIREVFNAYNESKDQLKDFAPHLRNGSLIDTCEAIWQFVHSNIKYETDPPFKQLIKEPARLFSDKSGDCKSFSVFIASCLYNLGINGIFRFVSFSSSELPTHVYVVVPDKNGNEIIIDAVLPWFNREKPYTYKHDYNMTEISRLSGVPNHGQRATGNRQRRALSVMGLEDNSNVSGFFDNLLGIDKKHIDLWHSNLPDTCAAYLYVFIPDNIIASMPAAVQAKRLKQIQSLQYMDQAGGAKYSYNTALFDINTAIVQNYGKEPLQVIDELFGEHIGDDESAASAASTASSAASTASTATAVVGIAVAFAKSLKNIFGKYGTYGFNFPAGLNPGDIAPSPSDWTGYQMMNTSANNVSSSAATLPGAVIPGTTQPMPGAIVQQQQGSSVNWLLWGGIGLGAFLLLKK